MGYSLPALRTTIPFVLLCAAQLVATPAHAARLFLPVNPSALKNPMKGWRGQINKYYWGSTPILDTTGGGAIPDSQPIWDTGEEENLESIRKWYVHWDEIENPADDEAAALQRIKDYTDRHLGSMPARNMKALPRVEIYTKAGLRVPAGSPELREVTVDGVLKRGDRDHPWWETEAVLSRILRLVSRLGKVWDNDPRIAAVQVGTQGKYGEMWGLSRMPDFEKKLGDAYMAAFQNKKLMIRTAGPYPWANSRALAESGPFGLYLDSYAFRGNEFSVSREPEMTSGLTLAGGERWKIAPMGGETPIKATNRNPKRIETSIFDDPVRRNYMYNCIRYSHNSWLGSGEGEQLSGGDRGVIHKFQKAMGYRFELQTSIYSRRATRKRGMRFGFVVKNTGSAPFLYNWPLMVSLVDEDRRVVWEKQFPVDITKWLPGSGWNLQSGGYAERAASYSHVTRFDMSNANLRAGAYTVCLSILDPSPPARAAVRFANKNYWRGGLHPVARIVWERRLTSADRQTPSFDNLFTGAVDNSLTYSA